MNASTTQQEAPLMQSTTTAPAVRRLTASERIRYARTAYSIRRRLDRVATRVAQVQS